MAGKRLLGTLGAATRGDQDTADDAAARMDSNTVGLRMCYPTLADASVHGSLAIDTLNHVAAASYLLLLVGLALSIYYTIFYLSLHLTAHRFFDLSKRQWHQALKNPGNLQGFIKAPLEYGLAHNGDADAIRQTVAEIRMEHLSVVERRLPFLFILISAAPLTGLLGTVVGMLTTFQGLGGQAQFTPLEMISSGISQALVTTQAGLIIAIPAYIAGALLKKRRDHLEANLMQMECALRANRPLEEAESLEPC